MKVSILTREYPPTIYGGAGVHVAQLVPQLARLVDVDVQCMGEPREGATAHPETFPEGANGAIRTLGADVSMAAAVPEVDVVHAHTWYAQFAGIIASRYQDIPLVVTAHSLEPDRPWKVEQLAGGYRVSSWIERTAYENADAVIAVSSAMITNIRNAYPFVEPERIHVVKNGIDTDEFHPVDESDVCARIGMDVNRPSVVFVGRITRQKGLVHLVRAARRFHPDTQLILLAGAPDTPEIAAEFNEAFGVLKSERGGVVWVQEMLPRADVRQVLSHATVFACPSIYEPLGIVNLEAMACETAVVGSAVGGIPEVVVDGETGLLVPYDPSRADDPAFIAEFESRFADRVNELTADPDRAWAMGRAGRQRCIDEFSWETIARQTVAVYEAAQARHERLRTP
ncbi:glycogen synthase [Aestuariimicrobium sp. T2.26MG-19.2B]|uniref:glycogen synthase n=1 Tax=Aestuariimicrobium sp. T2.26MG-19.2B TaxID=3040679 RepID=UPI0024778190|nr:glycogen synthase [Aestuariimicrobium sp. T2.26MG-19.2B]CAI9400131.1 Alpha-maltose-1-phosphate synthase [Aestuariimicrobium sp. T2.26MG-19.2B]